MNADILIVDDESAFHDLYGYVLTQMGLSHHTVSDGKAGLKALQNAEPLPLLILLDIRMPVMDGWEFRTRQLADSKLADIPVLFMSGGYPGDEEKALAMGGSYLPRPSELDRFRELVSEILERESPRDRDPE